MTILETIIMLKLILEILPLIPPVVADVEQAYEHVKDDPLISDKIANAQKALNDIGSTLTTLLKKIGQ